MYKLAVHSEGAVTGTLIPTDTVKMQSATVQAMELCLRMYVEQKWYLVIPRISTIE